MPDTFRVTPEWSNKEAGIAGGNGSLAVRSWLVTGTGTTVATVENALTAVDDTTLTNAVPSIGAAYDAVNLFFRCGDVRAKLVAPGVVRVTAQYGTIVPTAPSQDSISTPVVITLDQEEVEEDCDHDIDKLPIVNLCNNPMPGAKRTVRIYTVTLLKNLASFPGSLAATYANSVNNDDFTLPIIGTVPTGYARCVSILPANPMRIGDPFVPVKLTLQIYSSDAPADPWQYRIINQGSEAYAHSTTTGEPTTAQKGLICLDATNDVVSRDVLLDINGKPFDTTAYSVRAMQGKSPLDAFDTSPSAASIVARMTLPPDTTITGVVFLKYRRCYQRAFTSLISSLRMGS